MRSSTSALLSSLALVLAGCGDDGGDGDQPIDAIVPIDSAQVDGPPVDAAIDARPIDAMIDAPAVPMLNACTAAAAVDRTAAGASRTITFPAFTYTPPCIRIKVGQAVTWSGDFSFHPLRPGAIVGGAPTGQPGNPIPSTGVGMNAVANFAAAGEFGFYCNNHWPGGMKGAVYVVP